jgi:hypothetical protein
MEPQFRTRNRSANLLEHKTQVKVGLGNENKTMTRAARGRGMQGIWRHEHTGSRHERWSVHCACLVDVVHFSVWCRENARITVALCVCADAQL